MSVITQVLIFHPDCGRNANEVRNHDEFTADRQRHINLKLEEVQLDGDGKVREIVLGTNNFVYAVIDYPAEPHGDDSWSRLKTK